MCPPSKPQHTGKFKVKIHSPFSWSHPSSLPTGNCCVSHLVPNSPVWLPLDESTSGIFSAFLYFLVSSWFIYSSLSVLTHAVSPSWDMAPFPPFSFCFSFQYIHSPCSSSSVTVISPCLWSRDLGNHFMLPLSVSVYSRS